MANPIDLYKRFDRALFEGRNPEQNASAYARFLDQNEGAIGNALLDRARPEDFPPDFYGELSDLRCNESGASIGPRLRKASDPYPLNIEIDNLLEIAGVKANENIDRLIRGRTIAHLKRLVIPEEYFLGMHLPAGRYKNETCSTFGKEFLGGVAAWQSDEAVLDKVRSIIGLEGHGVFYFWTLAPYIHMDLKDGGYKPDESIETILRWVNDSDSLFSRGGELLKHLEFIEWHISMARLSALGYDERMPSHLMARILAKVVSRELAQD
jgi:hypothetical protein